MTAFDDRLWDFRDIATSWIDFRFRGKNGRAADITGTTEFDPICDMGRQICCDAQRGIPYDDVVACDIRASSRTIGCQSQQRPMSIDVFDAPNQPHYD